MQHNLLLTFRVYSNECGCDQCSVRDGALQVQQLHQRLMTEGGVVLAEDAWMLNMVSVCVGGGGGGGGGGFRKRREQ